MAPAPPRALLRSLLLPPRAALLLPPRASLLPPRAALFLLLLPLLATASASASPAAPAAATYNASVAVYGSTPAGIIAAVAAARRNASVVLLDPSPRIGGMCTGGLGFTDVGDAGVIGGYAREFFVRVARNYNATATAPLYTLEPHVAEAAFQAMLQGEAGAGGGRLTHVRVGPLTGVATDGRAPSRITALSFADGTTAAAAVFIDASYEGDVLPGAGVRFALGREPNTTYNESLGGRTRGAAIAVSPLDERGNLQPLFLTGAHAGPAGGGDALVQAYNFRLCVTRNASNALPWARPAGYNASEWALLRAYAAVAPPVLATFLKSIAALPGGKFDMVSAGVRAGGGGWWCVGLRGC